jgi:hypothetical protein
MSLFEAARSTTNRIRLDLKIISTGFLSSLSEQNKAHHHDMIFKSLFSNLHEKFREQLVLETSDLLIAVSTHPHPAPRLKTQYSYTSTLPLGFHGLL